MVVADRHVPFQGPPSGSPFPLGAEEEEGGVSLWGDPQVQLKQLRGSKDGQRRWSCWGEGGLLGGGGGEGERNTPRGAGQSAVGWGFGSCGRPGGAASVLREGRRALVLCWLPRAGGSSRGATTDEGAAGGPVQFGERLAVQTSSSGILTVNANPGARHTL